MPITDTDVNDTLGEMRFESLLNAFELPHYKNMIDASNSLHNTAFGKAMEFATAKLSMEVVEKNSRYYVMNTWIDYNRAIDLCTAVSAKIASYESTTFKQTIKDLIDNLKDKIKSNGEFAYYGDNKYTFNDLSVQLLKPLTANSEGEYLSNRYLFKITGLSGEENLELYFTIDSNNEVTIELN